MNTNRKGDICTMAALKYVFGERMTVVDIVSIREDWISTDFIPKLPQMLDDDALVLIWDSFYTRRIAEDKKNMDRTCPDFIYYVPGGQLDADFLFDLYSNSDGLTETEKVQLSRMYGGQTVMYIWPEL